MFYLDKYNQEWIFDVLIDYNWWIPCRDIIEELMVTGQMKN